MVAAAVAAPSPPPPPSSFTIGGTVSGLPSGGQVVLLNNGADNLTVTADGTFTFPTGLTSAAAYAVTVKTAPAGEICTVGSGSGTVASAAITNVTVTCADSYTIGGLVNGLTKGQQVVLLDNGGDSLTVTAYSSDSPAVVVEPNSAFSFTTALVSAAAYSVTVGTAPAGDTCAVSNGSGTVASANVTNVIVTCAPTPISGSKVLLELGPPYSRTGRRSLPASTNTRASCRSTSRRWTTPACVVCGPTPSPTVWWATVPKRESWVRYPAPSARCRR